MKAKRKSGHDCGPVYGVGALIKGASDQKREHLRIALEAAVPLHIQELKLLIPEDRVRHGIWCSRYLTEHGDQVLFNAKKPDANSVAFNMLAEGIALLAFQPGGVTAFGLKFQVYVDTESD